MHPDIDQLSCISCGAPMAAEEHECPECGESACPECGSPLEGGFAEKDCTNCEWTEKRYPAGANGFVSYPSPKERAQLKARGHVDPDEEAAARADYEYDAAKDRQFQEGVNFDKFMDRTLIIENRAKRVDASDVHPLRKVARHYQENPLGKTRMGVRRG